MDQDRFDQRTRALGAGRSRRGMLKAVGAAALGAVGLHAGAAEADLCKTTAKACSKGSQCCSGNCTPDPGKTSVTASGAICCPAGQIQTSTGQCGCPSGTTLHNGVCCTPTTTCPSGQTCGTAPDGCGGTLDCGSCDATQCLTCSSGTCVSSCGAGDVCCGGTCCASGQTCGQILEAGQGCCWPSGTANVCTVDNYLTACCATASSLGGQQVGCSQGACT